MAGIDKVVLVDFVAGFVLELTLSEPFQQDLVQDPAANDVHAGADGSDYLINGRKIWISKGGTADFIILMASTDPSKAARGITPVRLPSSNLLQSVDLRSQTFTAVGYGTVRDIKTTGPNAFYFDSTRRYATQFFLSLEPAWLNLSENPSTGSGGTCYGDSGGPHFLGGVTSNLQVAITVTGDTACRATDKTYRLDTASARGFLGQYVSLP